MRLTIHTDYALRFLTYAALPDSSKVSVKDAATRFGVSPNHLMKVAQGLAGAGFIEPVRGRGGGFKLARDPAAISVGDVVRALESDFGIVECMRNRGCLITPACRLPRLLNKAAEAFLAVLDGCTIAELVEDNSALIRILKVAP